MILSDNVYWELNNESSLFNHTSHPFRYLNNNNVIPPSDLIRIDNTNDIIYTDLNDIYNFNNSFTISFTLNDLDFTSTSNVNYLTFGYQSRNFEYKCVTIGKSNCKPTIGFIQKDKTVKASPHPDYHIPSGYTTYTLIHTSSLNDVNKFKLYQDSNLVCTASNIPQNKLDRFNILDAKMFLGTSAWTCEDGYQTIDSATNISFIDNIQFHARKMIYPPNSIINNFVNNGYKIFDNEQQLYRVPNIATSNDDFLFAFTIDNHEEIATNINPIVTLVTPGYYLESISLSEPYTFKVRRDDTYTHTTDINSIIYNIDINGTILSSLNFTNTLLLDDSYQQQILIDNNNPMFTYKPIIIENNRIGFKILDITDDYNDIFYKTDDNMYTAFGYHIYINASNLHHVKEIFIADPRVNHSELYFIDELLSEEYYHINGTIYDPVDHVTSNVMPLHSDDLISHYSPRLFRTADVTDPTTFNVSITHSFDDTTFKHSFQVDVTGIQDSYTDSNNILQVYSLLIHDNDSIVDVNDITPQFIIDRGSNVASFNNDQVHQTSFQIDKSHIDNFSLKIEQHYKLYISVIDTYHNTNTKHIDYMINQSIHSTNALTSFPLNNTVSTVGDNLIIQWDTIYPDVIHSFDLSVFNLNIDHSLIQNNNESYTSWIVTVPLSTFDIISDSIISYSLYYRNNILVFDNSLHSPLYVYVDPLTINDHLIQTTIYLNSIQFDNIYESLSHNPLISDNLSPLSFELTIKSNNNDLIMNTYNFNGNQHDIDTVLFSNLHEGQSYHSYLTVTNLLNISSEPTFINEFYIQSDTPFINYHVALSSPFDDQMSIILKAGELSASNYDQTSSFKIYFSVFDELLDETTLYNFFQAHPETLRTSNFIANTIVTIPESFIYNHDNLFIDTNANYYNVIDKFYHMNQTDLMDDVQYIVTVATGNQGGNKFFLNGIQQDVLVLHPGTTYRFDQSDATNTGHPIILQFTGPSFSQNDVLENIDGVTYFIDDVQQSDLMSYVTHFTSSSINRYVQYVVPTNNPPTTIYYVCRFHNGMGSSGTVSHALHSEDQWILKQLSPSYTYSNLYTSGMIIDSSHNKMIKSHQTTFDLSIHDLSFINISHDALNYVTSSNIIELSWNVKYPASNQDFNIQLCGYDLTNHIEKVQVQPHLNKCTWVTYLSNVDLSEFHGSNLSSGLQFDHLGNSLRTDTVIINNDLIIDTQYPDILVNYAFTDYDDFIHLNISTVHENIQTKPIQVTLYNEDISTSLVKSSNILYIDPPFNEIEFTISNLDVGTIYAIYYNVSDYIGNTSPDTYLQDHFNIRIMDNDFVHIQTNMLNDIVITDSHFTLSNTTFHDISSSFDVYACIFEKYVTDFDQMYDIMKNNQQISSSMYNSNNIPTGSTHHIDSHTLDKYYNVSNGQFEFFNSYVQYNLQLMGIDEVNNMTHKTITFSIQSLVDDDPTTTTTVDESSTSAGLSLHLVYDDASITRNVAGNTIANPVTNSVETTTEGHVNKNALVTTTDTVVTYTDNNIINTDQHNMAFTTWFKYDDSIENAELFHIDKMHKVEVHESYFIITWGDIKVFTENDFVLEPNVWYHIAINVTLSDLEIFLDGVSLPVFKSLSIPTVISSTPTDVAITESDEYTDVNGYQSLINGDKIYTSSQTDITIDDDDNVTWYSQDTQTFIYKFNDNTIVTSITFNSEYPLQSIYLYDNTDSLIEISESYENNIVQISLKNVAIISKLKIQLYSSSTSTTTSLPPPLSDNTVTRGISFMLNNRTTTYNSDVQESEELETLLNAYDENETVLWPDEEETTNTNDNSNGSQIVISNLVINGYLSKNYVTPSFSTINTNTVQISKNLNGALDDTRIYSRELNVTDVKKLNSIGGTIMHFDFDNDTVDQVTEKIRDVDARVIQSGVLTHESEQNDIIDSVVGTNSYQFSGNNHIEINNNIDALVPLDPNQLTVATWVKLAHSHNNDSFYPIVSIPNDIVLGIQSNQISVEFFNIQPFNASFDIVISNETPTSFDLTISNWTISHYSYSDHTYQIEIQISISLDFNIIDHTIHIPLLDLQSNTFTVLQPSENLSSNTTYHVRGHILNTTLNVDKYTLTVKSTTLSDGPILSDPEVEFFTTGNQIIIPNHLEQLDGFCLHIDVTGTPYSLEFNSVSFNATTLIGNMSFLNMSLLSVFTGPTGFLTFGDYESHQITVKIYENEGKHIIKYYVNGQYHPIYDDVYPTRALTLNSVDESFILNIVSDNTLVSMKINNLVYFANNIPTDLDIQNMSQGNFDNLSVKPLFHHDFKKITYLKELETISYTNTYMNNHYRGTNNPKLSASGYYEHDYTYVYPEINGNTQYDAIFRAQF